MSCFREEALSKYFCGLSCRIKSIKHRTRYISLEQHQDQKANVFPLQARCGPEGG